MNILVTGANRGIGFEMVKQAQQRGWRVFACCRRPDHADRLLKLAALANGQTSVHIVDMLEPATIQALAYELRNEPVDWLVNNAGVYGPERRQFGQVDVSGWLQAFQVNAIAPLKMAEALIEQVAMSRQKKIICIGSKMGSMADNGYGNSYIYRSSKAALNAVVKSLAIDLKARGVICAVMHPGWVKTDMGGPNAEITAGESVQQLFRHIENLGPQDSGRFIDIDGTDIPW